MRNDSKRCDLVLLKKPTKAINGRAIGTGKSGVRRGEQPSKAREQQVTSKDFRDGIKHVGGDI